MPNIDQVPYYLIKEFESRKSKYCLLIPIINEGERIYKELKRGKEGQIHQLVDIIICDGDSTDGSTDQDVLESLGVNSLLIKKDNGKQGSQLRMGIDYAIKRGYSGVITIDGNNKDSIESVPLFIEKLNDGYDFVQGSRYIEGGQAINTPIGRHLAVRFLHAPIISLTARHWFTDTTNGFRAYSIYYLKHPKVQVFRDVFMTYELLAYLSVRASQLGLKVGEVPVTREYPINEVTPTKIKGIKGNTLLLKILFKNYLRHYNPRINNHVR